MKQRKISLALSFEPGTLPTEFRLFVKGINSTEKGDFLFDDKAARSVMAAYRDWGVDVPIDLEHQMLECPGGTPDPTARDARGWAKLELRADGSLWCVGVKWTKDGAARLSDKRQRYISPAFEIEEGTNRILKIVNVALTALPATHKTPALVAASRRITATKGNSNMEAEMVLKALEAIEKGDASAAIEILKNMIASAAGADPEAEGDEPGEEGDGAEGIHEENAIDPKVVPASEDGEEYEEEKDPKKAKALRAMLGRLTDSKSFPEALLKIAEFRASHLTLEGERVKLAAERATLEKAERRKLVAELVTLGAEFPATVWADDKATALKPRWAKMPIAELRTHVADQRKARSAKKPGAAVKPPAGDANVEQLNVSSEIAALGLTAQELSICAATKCEPKDFAALKAFRDSKKGSV